MQPIKTLLAAGAVVMTALLSTPALAQATDNMTRGEVRKVDKDTAKITIKHEEIKSLDMPPMTMVFQVREPALLEKAKMGDKVRFSVEKREGAFVITALELAP